jgi:hypothetical protein
LKQTILGVKEHGHGVTIYRTCGTVKKHSNLSVYAILCQIEAWKLRNHYYPELLYLQVDGGSENANMLMMGFLELLASKRIVPTIYYTRLPTGHTHEDIDAVFGVIWKSNRLNSCETLDKFVHQVQQAFKSRTFNQSGSQEDGNNVEVRDVYVIPDYSSFISPVIDDHFKNMHKTLNTQHQWRFQSVAKDPLYFPFGCKTEFRAYASEKVVEFLVKPLEHCHTKIGKLTGLEPSTLYCRWYPTPTCYHDR